MIEQIIRKEKVLDFAVRRRDLARIEYSIHELSTLLKRLPVPKELTIIYSNYLIEKLERMMRHGIIPLMLFSDFQRMIENDFLNEKIDIDKIQFLNDDILIRTEKESPEKDIEKNLKQIQKLVIKEETPIVFFLGAGASKPEPSNIPTVSEMLKQLWKEVYRKQEIGYVSQLSSLR